MAIDWTAWFEGYAADAAREDPTALASRYASTFLAAAPAGHATFPNDAAFVDWLRRVREGNRAAGLTSLGVAATREVPLGPSFALVTVTWEATWRATGPRPIRFEISYLLETSGEPKVLAYVSHEDQEAAMRREGLSPG